MHQLLLREEADSLGVAYARYSTEFQHSVTDQVRTIFETAIKQKIYIPREFVFFNLAVSGRKSRRPGLDKVRGVLERKAATVLIVFTTNRLFRKTYACMKFVEEDVVERVLCCIFVKSNIDTAKADTWRIPLQVNAMMDEFATTMHAANIRAAQEGMLMNRIVSIKLCFGYMGVDIPGTLTKKNRPKRRIEIQSCRS